MRQLDLSPDVFQDHAGRNQRIVAEGMKLVILPVPATVFRSLEQDFHTGDPDGANDDVLSFH